MIPEAVTKEQNDEFKKLNFTKIIETFTKNTITSKYTLGSHYPYYRYRGRLTYPYLESTDTGTPVYFS